MKKAFFFLALIFLSVYSLQGQEYSRQEACDTYLRFFTNHTTELFDAVVVEQQHPVLLVLSGDECWHARSLIELPAYYTNLLVRSTINRWLAKYSDVRIISAWQYNYEGRTMDMLLGITEENEGDNHMGVSFRYDETTQYFEIAILMSK